MAVELCNFCGRDSKDKDVASLFRANDVGICNICVADCQAIAVERDRERQSAIQKAAEGPGLLKALQWVKSSLSDWLLAKHPKGHPWFGQHLIKDPRCREIISSTLQLLNEKPLTGPILVEVNEQADGSYKANVLGHTELWDVGPSPDAALGALVRTHYDVIPVKAKIKTRKQQEEDSSTTT